MKRSDIVLTIVLVLAVFIFISSRLGTNNFLVVLSESMNPTINMGDLVITSSVDSNDIKVGDIVAFNDGDKQFPVTHRVINVTATGFVTKGDANEDPDFKVRSKSSVVGKIVFWVPFAGYLVYFSRSIYGLIFLIVIPGAFLIFTEIKNMFRYVKEDKVRKRKIQKSNRLLRSLILILSFSLLASQALVFSSNGITSAYFSDVEAGQGFFQAWIQETSPTTIEKWWSDTEFVPMSDPRYDNSFNVVVLKKSGKVTSTNPGGFYINIIISDVPATNSLSVVDTISGEIRPSGDFVKWPMFHGNPLHVYLNGIDITNKFDWNFDNKVLTINLKSGQSIDGGELYITLHLKYALIGTKLTKDEKALFPRVYTNLASATINGNRIDSSPATLTAHLKFSSCSCSRSCKGSDIKIDEDVDSEVLGTLCENDCDFEYYIIDTTVEGSGILGGMQTETDMTSPLWLENSINSTLAGTPIEHSVLWSDESLSGYIFSFDNCEGLFVNDTWTPFADNWSNVTKMVNSTVNCTINWMVYANDTSNNWNTSEFNYVTTAVPDLIAPTWSDNSANSTLAGTEVEHSILWNDDTQLSGYIFSFDDCTGEFVNETWIPFVDNWSNVTKLINSTIGCSVRWKIYANDSSNNWNETEEFNYTTTVAPDLTPPLWSDNSTNSTLAGTDVLHSVLWSDDVQLSGYIFSFDNCEGLMVNETWAPFIDGWSNVTKTVNSTIDCTVNWMVYANDTSNNWNVTDLFSYTTS